MARVDDPSIRDAVTLYRRVPTDQRKFDKNLACWRCSSSLIKHEEMSIDRGDELKKMGLGPEAAMEGFPDEWQIAIPAGVARHSAGQSLVRDGDPPNKPWHGLVCGDKAPAGKVPKPWQILAAHAVWVVPPPENPCARPYPREAERFEDA